MSAILLVDDDVELGRMFVDYLAREGFAARHVTDGASGVREALSGTFDLAVLDVMMPKVDGIEALRRIRAQSRMPVLMLTAKGDDVDRIVGLELGADDYVTKPCTPRELVARIRAILRRVQGDAQDSATPDSITIGPLIVFPQKRVAQWQGAPIEFTSTEFNLLEVLARNAGKLVTKNELSERALGRPLSRFDRSVDVHLSSIRHKLRNVADGDLCIETVRGQGYQLLTP